VTFDRFWIANCPRILADIKRSIPLRSRLRGPYDGRILLGLIQRALGALFRVRRHETIAGHDVPANDWKMAQTIEPWRQNLGPRFNAALALESFVGRT